MKKIYQYSEKKFSSFDEEKQLKILHQMMNHLLNIWDDDDQRKMMIRSINDCLSYPQVSTEIEFPEKSMNKRAITLMMMKIERKLNIDIDDKRIVAYKQSCNCHSGSRYSR